MVEILPAVEASIVILYFSSHLTFLSYSFGLEKALSALEDCRTVHLRHVKSRSISKGLDRICRPVNHEIILAILIDIEDAIIHVPTCICLEEVDCSYDILSTAEACDIEIIPFKFFLS